jgi:protein TonB
MQFRKIFAFMTSVMVHGGVMFSLKHEDDNPPFMPQATQPMEVVLVETTPLQSYPQPPPQIQPQEQPQNEFQPQSPQQKIAVTPPEPVVTVSIPQGLEKKVPANKRALVKPVNPVKPVKIVLLRSKQAKQVQKPSNKPTNAPSERGAERVSPPPLAVSDTTRSKATAPRVPQPEVHAASPSQPPRETDAQYRQKVIQLIKAHKIYPEKARLFEQQGRGIICLTIDKSGVLNHTFVKESTGFPLLDAGMAASIKAVGRFPPLESGEVSITLDVPMIFDLDS